ncbi:MAG: hypothetical protein ACLQJR_34535 [Stellaceae bacterium]
MMPASSRFSRVIGGAAALLLLGAGGPGAAAEKLAERTNRGLVELMIPGDAAAMAMAQDLAGVLDDGATRRLLPVIGRDAVEGLVDLKALRGVDIAIAQTDVLAAASSNAALAADDGVFTYITKLHDEELHLLARAEIGRIEDLAGKKVDFAGGAGITGPAVLGLLKLKVEPVFDDRARALQKLAAGEVAAMAYVAAKPTPLFDAPAGEGLHFLAVPMTPALAEAYVPARLTAADYPRLVAADAPVDTVAVGTALMVANLTPGTERYRNLENFVEALFTQFPHLLEKPHQAKWQEVNLAAELPGWKRFPAADAWLKRNAVAAAPPLGPKELHEIFAKFLDERSRLAGGRALSSQEKDQLFDQFQRWQQQSAQAR